MAGYSTHQPIDPNEYPDRSNMGLEGPFRQRSGPVLYYDKRKGQYYDIKTDMYIPSEDYDAMNNPPSREINMSSKNCLDYLNGDQVMVVEANIKPLFLTNMEKSHLLQLFMII